jgi:A/G-specific adenine glycosylase
MPEERSPASRRRGTRPTRPFSWRVSIPLLVAWYGRNHRDLPWRRTKDPYTIWVSEMMLQQTRVDSALPYFERFMRRFPDLESLASASLEEVLKLWEGLGYYRRAGYLRDGARWIQAHGGWPGSAHGLRSVPGIGRYTAGAMASICFGERAPVLDGNVRRVWSRVFAIDAAHAKEAEDRMWGFSSKAVRFGPPDEVNQALMELGAILCTPRSPGCQRCPLRRWCASAFDGKAETRPKSPRKPPFRVDEVAVGLLMRSGTLFVQRRPEGALLGGLWELPGGKLKEGETPEACLVREFEEEVGVPIAIGGKLPVIEHRYSHFGVRLHPYWCTATRRVPLPQPSPERKWIAPGEIGSLPFPSATLKIFALAFPREDPKEKAADEPAAYSTD